MTVTITECGLHGVWHHRRLPASCRPQLPHGVALTPSDRHGGSGAALDSLRAWRMAARRRWASCGVRGSDGKR
jgi:hypothetical protein